MSRIYEALKKAELDRAMAMHSGDARPATNADGDFDRHAAIRLADPAHMPNFIPSNAPAAAWPADWFRRAGI